MCMFSTWYKSNINIILLFTILRYLKFTPEESGEGAVSRIFKLPKSGEGAVSAALQVESSSTTGYLHLQKCEYSVGKRA